ncbi:uncharacterized protein LOC110458541 [Mizuhopecten yessoensis]|uniref:Cytochrome c oxidase subunit 6A, mitochondrial n=1 Tax=Mizuhopecten yessoensis TaxID=6573 RepID=A0A210Q6H7_MIZYE|nr:uncharacterized protein LOC110458541 [Mizuhopecten yessoensis]OWF44347.1 Cytochrome c oxidase subunit 6A, mitochondrial [Mizuhopecten yessoensis]
MSLARVGFVRHALKNAVKRPAKQQKRDCGFVQRQTDSVKEAAHDFYIPEYRVEYKSQIRNVILRTIPFVGTCLGMAYLTEEHGHGRVEYMPYDYMYIRKNAFPWGDGNHSFLHHPLNNCLPEGWPADEE